VKEIGVLEGKKGVPAASSITVLGTITVENERRDIFISGRYFSLKN
jgi:hypothetical protein